MDVRPFAHIGVGRISPGFVVIIAAPILCQTSRYPFRELERATAGAVLERDGSQQNWNSRGGGHSAGDRESGEIRTERIELCLRERKLCAQPDIRRVYQQVGTSPALEECAECCSVKQSPFPRIGCYIAPAEGRRREPDKIRRKHPLLESAFGIPGKKA